MKEKSPEEIFVKELERLFLAAKEKDEFEYVCALMNFSGMGDARALSHIYESQELLFQVSEQIKAAKNLHEATRFFLLLYCHIFEMDEFYNIIGNMLRITLGERYGVLLYNSPTIKPELKPANKIDKLASLAKKAKFELLTDTVYSLYSSPLRNSFFHSSYSLSGDNYHIVSGKNFKINGVMTPMASIRDYVIPMTQSTVNMGGNFFNILNQARLSYKENKTVIGRLQPDGVKIEIMGHPENGLSGFRTINE